MKTVSLYVFVLVGNIYKILVQRRAKKKEKEGRLVPQSSAGVYQPSANGKMKKKESIKKALKRETHEELGRKFARNFFKQCKLTALPAGKFFAKEKGEVSITYNFLGEISEKQMELIKLHKEADKLVLIGKEDIPRIKKEDDILRKKSDIPFFPDQYPIILDLLNNIEKLGGLPKN